MIDRNRSADSEGCLGLILTLVLAAALAVSLGMWIANHFLPK